MLNKQSFKNPDALYRSAPFWALNHQLEPQQLKHQINLFKEQGMGGVFLHPRGGMSTEYLSSDYFDAIKACIEQLEQLNMISWLYDEDRFPSGVAGGMVVKQDNSFAQTCIVPRITDVSEVERESLLALYLLNQNDYTPVDNVPSEGKVLAVYLSETHKQSRYNGESYVDVCNKQAIDQFIKITHEKYYQHFSNHFGGVIPAIFTDEPHFNPGIENALPWTKDFQTKFKNKYKYDLLKHLACLFLDIGDYKKIRFDYWNLVSSLFVRSYSKNIFDWCEQKGIAYTGHFWEHEFPIPTYTGSVMPHYEYMQYPGIDMLFVSDSERTEQYGNDFIVKEASSVANQLGKSRVLSETYGASGWGLDFAYQKRALDWQLALGINLFSQHLSMYSMVGYRKRDFPQSFLNHQPWWEHYKIMGDYIGRMCYALSRGKYQCDVLVLHPSSSTWALYGTLSSKSALIDMAKSSMDVVKCLNQAQVMFDLGDDLIISAHGQIENRKLVVGEMSYSVVVVADMEIIRTEVFNLLTDFSKAGGLIVTAQNPPTLLDGEKSKKLVDFFAGGSIIKTNSACEICNKIKSLDVTKLEIEEFDGKDISDIYAQIRTQGHKQLIFICNLNMEQKFNIKIPVGEPCEIEQFNAETGASTLCKVYGTQGRCYIVLELEPLNSTLLCIDSTKQVKVASFAAEQTNFDTVNLSGWTSELIDYNAINLQFCTASLNDTTKTGDVLKIDDLFKDSLGIERGNIFVRQPWMYSYEEKSNLHSVQAEYVFVVDSMPDGDLMAAVELPDIFDVYINNVKVYPNGDYYKDRALALYNIKQHVEPGKNVIKVQTEKYGVTVNLESVYVVGQFKLSASAKDGQFVIQRPDSITAGDVTTQGYPYYSGKISYSTDVNINCDVSEAVLKFGNFDGVTATVSVNSNKVKTVGWQPYCADITDFIHKGKNTITIEITNSLQNLMGPFSNDSNLNLVTPGSFYADKHEKFLPFGFSGVAEIYYKEALDEVRIF